MAKLLKNKVPSFKQQYERLEREIESDYKLRENWYDRMGKPKINESDMKLLRDSTRMKEWKLKRMIKR